MLGGAGARLVPSRIAGNPGPGLRGGAALTSSWQEGALGMAQLQIEAFDDIEEAIDRVAMLDEDEQRLLALVGELRAEARDAYDALVAGLGPRPPDPGEERERPAHAGGLSAMLDGAYRPPAPAPPELGGRGGLLAHQPEAPEGNWYKAPSQVLRGQTRRTQRPHPVRPAPPPARGRPRRSRPAPRPSSAPGPGGPTPPADSRKGAGRCRRCGRPGSGGPGAARAAAAAAA